MIETSFQRLHVGSVKDIYQTEKPDELAFLFSDRYSIFDWGEMPDLIPGKGAALASMGISLLRMLGRNGIHTHLIDHPTQFRVKKITVPRSETAENGRLPSYEKKPENTLIPLEVIYRLGVPKGSSLLKRYPGRYQEGETFETPLIDYTTKLERMDRALSPDEARTLSCMSDHEWRELENTTKKIVKILKDTFQRAGLTLWDGKIEFAFSQRQANGERSILLVDSIGLDEIRLTLGDQILSKELMRQHYAESLWVQSLKIAKEKSTTNFRTICQNDFGISPKPLPTACLNAISSLYTQTANLIHTACETDGKINETHYSQLQQTLKTLQSLKPQANVLVLGSGGREHAIAWRLLQDESISKCFVLPGNPGMLNTSGIIISDDTPQTKEGVVQFCQDQNINLVVIGPEKYLFEGWADYFSAHGIPAFGPKLSASQLESSKLFSKRFMQEVSIPTARFHECADLPSCVQFIETSNYDGYVLKLSGPALGKGVVVCDTKQEAMQAAKDFFTYRPAGIEDGLFIEEKVSGREVSLFYACDGVHGQFVASACDHKRLHDHDQGPNTGGMGAYSPADFVDVTLGSYFLSWVEEKIVNPTLRGMNARGYPFQGMLFLGLMVPTSDFKKSILLEYNVRFGDPETQTFLPLLTGNFHHFLQDCKAYPISVNPLSAVHVVKAANGYPGLLGASIESGQKIVQSKNNPFPNEVLPFFAGVKTASDNQSQLVTSGGRVLGITAIAKTRQEARLKAYQALPLFCFSNEQFRTDIGAKT